MPSLPAINPDRPKIAVRRIVAFQSETFMTSERNDQVELLKMLVLLHSFNRRSGVQPGSRIEDRATDSENKRNDVRRG